VFDLSVNKVYALVGISTAGVAHVNSITFGGVPYSTTIAVAELVLVAVNLADGMCE